MKTKGDHKKSVKAKKPKKQTHEQMHEEMRTAFNELRNHVEALENLPVIVGVGEKGEKGEPGERGPAGKSWRWPWEWDG